MPCLNEAETLATCIRKAQAAIEKQDLAAEIIVADNGSTDGSQLLAHELGVRVVDVERKGYGSALIAGSGPAFLGLAARISEDRAPVTLIGDRDDVPDLLGAADFAVVTSVWEGQPLFVQEALAAGVPLITTAVGGIPELVGQAALLIPPHDVDGAAEAIEKLLDDPALRAAYGKRGLAQAATWPTEADTLAQVEAVYAELAAK